MNWILNLLKDHDPFHNLAAVGVEGNYRTLKRRIESMGQVKELSRRRGAAVSTALLLVTLIAVVPWRLVAEESVPANTEKPSSSPLPPNDTAKQHPIKATEPTPPAPTEPLAEKGLTPEEANLHQSVENLQRLMKALHTYHDIADHFPPTYFGNHYDKDPFKVHKESPYLSWRVRLLPILGEQELFKKFKLNEPWDSEQNRKLIPLIPNVFRAPGSKSDPGKTNYLGVVGAGAAFPEKGANTFGDFPDGTSKTIMLVEVPDGLAVEWTKPADFPIDTKDAVKQLVGLRKGGFLTAFADGGAPFVDAKISEEGLRNRLTRNGRAADPDPYTHAEWQKLVRGVPPIDKPKAAK
ncbi:MAG: DUF1559 domain-containing protein [Planctomycetota bacterium]|nr:DUF1559 domain-containing protein [Planctomycetota bacterium]